MSMGKKRVYLPGYSESAPDYVKSAGHIYKISGVILQGKGRNIIVLLPTANDFDSSEDHAEIKRHTLTEWAELLRQTDDPVYFKDEEVGGHIVKSVHRKCMAAISGAVQQRVWARDEFRCMYCNGEMGKVQLTVDHWVPLELGGSNDMLNLISACRKCNKMKGDLPAVDYCNEEGLDYDGLVMYLTGAMSAMFVGHLQ